MNMHARKDLDTLTEHGAAILASRIRRYWEATGGVVNVWTERLSRPAGLGGSNSMTWQVRSDLINGLPRAGAL